MTQLTKGKAKQCLLLCYVTSCTGDDVGLYVRVQTYTYIYQCDRDGPDSSVGINTRLRAGQSGVRTPVGTIFPIGPERPRGPPSLLYKGYWVSSAGVMRPWRGVDHSPPSSAEVKEGVQLYLYSPSGHSWCYRAQFTSYFIIYVIGYTRDEVSVFTCNDMNTFTYPLTWRQINTVSAWLPKTHFNNTHTCTYVFRYTLPGTEGRSCDTRYSLFTTCFFICGRLSSICSALCFSTKCCLLSGAAAVLCNQRPASFST